MPKVALIYYAFSLFSQSIASYVVKAVVCIGINTPALSLKFWSFSVSTSKRSILVTCKQPSLLCHGSHYCRHTFFQRNKHITMTFVSVSNEALKAKTATSNENADDDAHVTYEDNNSLLARTKHHHLTVCMVPPTSSRDVWENLTRARKELRDPGYFRWPPHANLLYPFVNLRPQLSPDTENIVSQGVNGTSIMFEKQQTSKIDPIILDRLVAACRQCEPFICRLTEFGTFGGIKRGVLWVTPDSNMNLPVSAALDTTPLIRLQKLLEEQFPECNDQRKVSGSFVPHMTLSHFANIDEALQAQRTIAKWWPSSLEFQVEEIYLLERKGDDGQFLRVADIRLGSSVEPSERIATYTNKPIPFQYMPATEELWVYEERMKLKQRRNRKGTGNYRRTLT